MTESEALAQTQNVMRVLSVLNLHFFARSFNGMHSPDHIGSAWHGGLGKMLHDAHPEAYKLLYEHPQSACKPYILTSPHYPADYLADNTPFDFQLTLLGQAAQSVAREIQRAFFQLAREGVGPKRGQFMIEDIQKTLFSPHSLTLLPAPKPVRFVFETPTLLKQNNAVLHTAPSLNVLMQRILFRVESILQLDRPADAPKAQIVPPPLWKHLLHETAQVALLEDHTQWQQKSRYSARQKAWMPFGGIQGAVFYGAVSPVVALWLQLAQTVYLGNKTTFHHGKVSVSLETGLTA